jgi:hypothetical protein
MTFVAQNIFYEAKMKQILVIVIGALVIAGVAGGVGYALGTQNGMAQAQNIRNEFFQQRGGPFGQGTNPSAAGTPFAGQGQPGAFGGRGTSGVVKSVDGNTIQLTAQDGSSITVKVDNNTTYQKTTTATLADVKANTRITVIGETSSGTVTARSIQITGSNQ